MGFMNNMRLKAELKVLDRVVSRMRSARPDLTPRIVSARCVEGEEHAGILFRWGRNDYKLLVLCQPTWWAQDIEGRLAGEMLISPTAPDAYLLGRVVADDEAIANGTTSPEVLAMAVVSSAPNVR